MNFARLRYVCVTKTARGARLVEFCQPESEWQPEENHPVDLMRLDTLPNAIEAWLAGRPFSDVVCELTSGFTLFPSDVEQAKKTAETLLSSLDLERANCPITSNDVAEAVDDVECPKCSVRISIDDTVCGTCGHSLK